MITDVISDNDLIYLSEFAKLHKYFFIEVLKMVYCLD